MSAKIPVNPPTRGEPAYGFGWVRVQLPGAMGDVGCNPPLMPGGIPIVGKGAPSQLVLYHQGNLPGALSAVNLVPHTESAIVILSNSFTLNDTPDWIGQLVLEERLEVPHRNDYIKAASESVAENAKWYPTTFEELVAARKNGTSPKDLDAYVGTYWDDIHVFKIEVFVEKDKLYWKLQVLESEKFPLESL